MASTVGDTLTKEEEEELEWQKGVSYSSLHLNALKAAWVLCEASVQISQQACRCGVVQGLRRLPIDKMVLGCGLLQLVMRDAQNLAMISQHHGEDVLEKMLMFMVTSGVPSLMRYGALGCARVALSVAGRRRLIAVPGSQSSIACLLMLLRWTDCATTQVHSGQALLNLSKSKTIQVMIAKQGLYTLIEVSWSPLSEEARLIINGVLFNVANNANNRDRLYRAELHIKTVLQTGVKSRSLHDTLSQMPRHVQASLKAIGPRRPGSRGGRHGQEDSNRPGQRPSPLDSKGSAKVQRARKKSQQRRKNYNQWIEGVSRGIASSQARNARERSRSSGSVSSAGSRAGDEGFTPSPLSTGSASAELDSVEDELSAVEVLFRGLKRKPETQYLPQLASVLPQPRFEMLPATGLMPGSVSLASIPGTAVWDPGLVSAVAAGGDSLGFPTTGGASGGGGGGGGGGSSVNNSDALLDESELPAAVEDHLIEMSLLGVSGVPLLGQSMRKPMRSMYSTIPPNSPLEPLATKVPRKWIAPQNLPPLLTAKKHSNSLPPGIVDRDAIARLGLRSEADLQRSVEKSFWARGPMNVKTLNPSARNIVDFIEVKVVGAKGGAGVKGSREGEESAAEEVAARVATATEDEYDGFGDYEHDKERSASLPSKVTYTNSSAGGSNNSFRWRLHGKAYYWRSMVQVTDSFGVQMIVTCQVLIEADAPPKPPLDLPEGINDRLPPPPENPALPQNNPTPFDVPALGPPVPQKHLLPVDEHLCHCGVHEPTDCGWQLVSSHALTSHARYSGYDGGLCGMFGRLRDRHMQMRVRLHRIVHEHEVEEEDAPEWIFHSRLLEADSKSYFDEPTFPLMLESDYARVASQQHFTDFLKAKLLCSEEEVIAALEGCKAALERPGVYQHLMHSFEFYSAMGNSSDMSQMLYNQCMDMMADTELVEPGNKKMDRAALDNIFIQANVEGDEQDDDDTGDTNADRALMRFELVEMLIRIAMQKFVAAAGGDGSCAGLPEAMTKVLDEHILPNDAAGSCSAAIHDIDQFRRDCLYTEEVDGLLRKHDRILLAIFEKFQDEDNNRKKLPRMNFKYFMRFLKQVKVRVFGGGVCVYVCVLSLYCSSSLCAVRCRRWCT